LVAAVFLGQRPLYASFIRHFAQRVGSRDALTLRFGYFLSSFFG
jgi:hypothetical protein